jgi:hypothetical protein
MIRRGCSLYITASARKNGAATVSPGAKPAQQSRKISERKLTIGLDLGDRNSWYCVPEESGAVVLEQKLSTTPKAMKEVFGEMPCSRIALETGRLATVVTARREKTLPNGKTKELT